MDKPTIKVTVYFYEKYWLALFERNSVEGYAVARHIFGNEPTDAGLYQFVLNHFQSLKFTDPKQTFELKIKRKNPKRLSREVRKEIEKFALNKTSFAQDVLRQEIEKNKIILKKLTREQKELEAKERFQLKQLKRKEKKKGH